LRYWRYWTLASITIAIFCGCDWGTGPRGCDICTSSAIVHGAVRSSAGAAVSGVRVSAEARSPSCSSEAIGGADSPGITDTHGVYSMRVRSPTSPRAVCLIVLGQPSDSMSLRSAADTGHVVRLEADYPGGQPYDSVQVDLILPTRN
jgi:hypothetical protein